MLKGKGILSVLQKKALLSFPRVPDSENFYLTGGTALAEFYLGHRRSYDLDFFTSEKDLIPPFTKALESYFEEEGWSVVASRRFQTFVEIELTEGDDSTLIHLAYDSPYRFSSPILADIGVLVNDYEDLSTDKLLAFFGRAEPRDAVDLYMIMDRDDIWTLAESAVKKDPGFDLYWFAVACEKVRDFPDEVERWPVEMLVQVDARQLKSRFESVALQTMDRIRKGGSGGV